MLNIKKEELDFKWDQMRKEREEFFSYREKNTNRHLAIFGAGALGRMMLLLLRESGISVNCFIDNSPSKQDGILEGIPIYSLTKIASELDRYDIVLCDSYAAEKRKQLNTYSKTEGIFELDEIFSKDVSRYSYDYFQEHIDLFQQTYDWLEDSDSKNIFEATIKRNITGNIHYLDQIRIQDGENERFITTKDMEHQYFVDYVQDDYSDKVFVDAGAFTGDTIKEFIEFTGGRYGKIISIEADIVNFRTLKNYIDQEKIAVSLQNFALYSEDGEMAFNGGGGDGSRLLENETSSKIGCVPTRSLDSFLDGERVDFIKMDIEGAELEALKGAREAIGTYLPKLAICVYHRPEDMITIPQYIKSISSNYKLYLKLHGRSSSDLVLYAISDVR